jgi:DNA-binding NtrC family response regulator
LTGHSVTPWNDSGWNALGAQGNGVLTHSMEHSDISVLVVEDEPLIRISVVEELEDLGFSVFDAENADDALIILASQPGITTVFTDVDMPGSMNGVQLALLIRTRNPDISVIVASGYLKVPRSFLPENVPFFSKPYRMEAVVEQIRASRIAGRG